MVPEILNQPALPNSSQGNPGLPTQAPTGSSLHNLHLKEQDEVIVLWKRGALIQQIAELREHTACGSQIQP